MQIIRHVSVFNNYEGHWIIYYGQLQRIHELLIVEMLMVQSYKHATDEGESTSRVSRGVITRKIF